MRIADDGESGIQVPQTISNAHSVLSNYTLYKIYSANQAL